MVERGHRRSARISALEALRAQQQGRGGRAPEDDRGKQIEIIEQELNNSLQELSERKRGRKKRKLRTVEDVVVSSVERAVDQGTQIQKPEDHSNYTSQPSTLPLICQVPDRQLLELIIDILQERDWKRVFAQAVSFDEVEGYYDIIKEPMDFGTMKAKIKEGVYTTLEAFKHDVFLVSGNAMHFNASGTFYFKQGYAIDELARRIFHVLKTVDPEDYRFALSKLRIRRGRKPGSFIKHARKERPGGTAKRGRPVSVYGSSSLQRNAQAYTGAAAPSSHIDGNDYETLPGCRDGRGSNICEEEDRRSVKPWDCYLNSHESIASTVYDSPKQLLHVEEGGITYKESLMQFVKDLGPVAQMVAKRKIQTSQVRATNCQNPVASTRQGLIPPKKIINVPASLNFSVHPTVNTSTTEKLESRNAFREMGYQSHSTEPRLSAGNSTFPTNGMTNSGNGYLGAVVSGKLENQASVTDLASKLSPTKLLEFLCRRNTGGSSPSSYRFQPVRESHPSQVSSSTHEFGSSSQGGGNQATSSSSSYRVSVPQGGLTPQWNQSNLGQRGEQIQARVERGPTYGTNTAHLGQLLEWNRHNLASQSFRGEDLAMATPGPSHAVSPSEAAVVNWNLPNLGMHSLQGKQKQVQVEQNQPYMANSSLLGQVLDWNQQNLGRSPFAGENLMMDKPGANCTGTLAGAGPLMEWNQSNLSSHYFASENLAVASASASHRAGTSAEAETGLEWNRSSLGSLPMNAENQTMDATGFMYGVNSAAQGNLIPGWNKNNYGVTEVMGTSGLGYPMHMTQASTVPEWTQNLQRQCNTQGLYDMSYMQNGFVQPQVRLSSAPEGPHLNPMAFYGSVPTQNHHQADANTLSLFDNQQLDLALQL